MLLLSVHDLSPQTTDCPRSLQAKRNFFLAIQSPKSDRQKSFADLLFTNCQPVQPPPPDMDLDTQANSPWKKREQCPLALRRQRHAQGRLAAKRGHKRLYFAKRRKTHGRVSSILAPNLCGW